MLDDHAHHRTVALLTPCPTHHRCTHAEKDPALARQFRDTSRLDKQRASVWDQLGGGGSFNDPVLWGLPADFKGKSTAELQQIYQANLITPNKGEDVVDAYLRENLAKSTRNNGEDALNLFYTCCKSKGLKECVNTNGETAGGAVVTGPGGTAAVVPSLTLRSCCAPALPVPQTLALSPSWDHWTLLMASAAAL